MGDKHFAKPFWAPDKASLATASNNAYFDRKSCALPILRPYSARRR